MNTSADTPQGTAEQFLSSPWLTGSLAALELVLGFILLSFPYLLGLSAAWVGGFVLLFAGVLRLVQGMRYADHRRWNLLAGPYTWAWARSWCSCR